MTEPKVVKTVRLFDSVNAAIMLAVQTSRAGIITPIFDAGEWDGEKLTHDETMKLALAINLCEAQNKVTQREAELRKLYARLRQVQAQVFDLSMDCPVCGVAAEFVEDTMGDAAYEAGFECDCGYTEAR